MQLNGHILFYDFKIVSNFSGVGQETNTELFLLLNAGPKNERMCDITHLFCYLLSW